MMKRAAQKVPECAIQLFSSFILLKIIRHSSVIQEYTISRETNHFNSSIFFPNIRSQILTHLYGLTLDHCNPVRESLENFRLLCNQVEPAIEWVFIDEYYNVVWATHRSLWSHTRIRMNKASGWLGLALLSCEIGERQLFTKVPGRQVSGWH